MRVPQVDSVSNATLDMPSRHDGILPQATCHIPSIHGIRWKKPCRWCPKVPEYKQGSCSDVGADCGDCLARCRNQFTSAGGWSIKATPGGEHCVPHI